MSQPSVRVAFGKRGSRSTLADENSPPSRNARQLALAYHIEALIEEVRLQSYAHAARVLGVTRARLTLIMNLLTLAPQIQDRMLEEKRLPERTLRAMTRLRDWSRQGALMRTNPFKRSRFTPSHTGAIVTVGCPNWASRDRSRGSVVLLAKTTF